MAQGRNIDYMGIESRDAKQHKHYETLFNRSIAPTRYCDDTCLHSLGLYNSVKWMLDMVGLTHFYERKGPTYVRLTLEVLSFLSYTTHLMTANSVRSISFRMFYKEYTYDQNAIADMLHFPYGEGVVCETPLDIDLVLEFESF